jgi:hypothetical protein
MNIWVPRAKIIEPRQELLLPIRCAGRYKLTAIRPDGRERPLTGWFSNLVLDQGLNQAGTAASWMAACRVGTGNTAPAVTDTNLVAHLAGTTTVNADQTNIEASSPYYVWRIRTFRFAQGAAAGNLAEVGIGTSASNGANLFSRELIRDGVGSPTTITVQGDEFLDVVYEHRLYPADLVDVNGNVTISAVNYTTVSRTSHAGPGGSNNWKVPYALVSTGSPLIAIAYNGALGAVTAQPSGTSSGATSFSQAAYTNGNFYRDDTWTWGLNAGNVAGGITAIDIPFGSFAGQSSIGASQMSFSPAIPKDNTKVLAITFRRSLARHTI